MRALSILLKVNPQVIVTALAKTQMASAYAKVRSQKKKQNRLKKMQIAS